MSRTLGDRRLGGPDGRPGASRRDPLQSAGGRRDSAALDSRPAILLDTTGTIAVTYRPLRFDPAYRPFVTPECIWILPLSADPARYRVLCPSRMRPKLLDLAIQGKLELKQYPGCPAEAAAAVREQLIAVCRSRAEAAANRWNTLVVGGGGLAVLGLINWFVPDPLPLVDELLLTFGGAGLAYAGYTRRRRDLPALRDKAELAARALVSLRPIEDPLLGRIASAIRARTRPDSGDWTDPRLDPLEAESAWLVVHLDLRSAREQGEVTEAQLRNLVRVVEDALPLRRLRTLSRRVHERPADRRARKGLAKVADHHGMSRDAVAVYGEFHRIARETLED